MGQSGLGTRESGQGREGTDTQTGTAFDSLSHPTPRRDARPPGDIPPPLRFSSSPTRTRPRPSRSSSAAFPARYRQFCGQISCSNIPLSLPLSLSPRIQMRSKQCLPPVLCCEKAPRSAGAARKTPCHPIPRIVEGGGMKGRKGRGDPRREGRVIINLIRERGNKGQLLSGEGLDRGPVQSSLASPAPARRIVVSSGTTSTIIINKTCL